MAEPVRHLDAFCDVCQEVRSCALRPEDPGSCACVVCGHVILTMKPIGSPDSLPGKPIRTR